MPPVPPDIWFAAAVAGCLLVCWELCSPGRVFPAALGSLLSLAGGWEIVQRGPRPLAIVLLAMALVGAITIALGRGGKLLWMATAIFCVLGCAFLLPQPNALSAYISIPLSTALSLVVITLLRIQTVARASKRNVRGTV